MYFLMPDYASVFLLSFCRHILNSSLQIKVSRMFFYDSISRVVVSFNRNIFSNLTWSSIQISAWNIHFQPLPRNGVSSNIAGCVVASGCSWNPQLRDRGATVRKHSRVQRWTFASGISRMLHFMDGIPLYLRKSHFLKYDVVPRARF